MDAGRCVEFDHAYKLLVQKIGDEKITNTKGMFAKLIKNTGKASANLLFDKAK